MRQSSSGGESSQQETAELSSSLSSVRQCPVLAAFYENRTTPWSAEKLVRLCSTAVAGGSSSRAVSHRKKLVYTSSTNQLYIHVVNATDAARAASADHVLLRYDGL